MRTKGWVWDDRKLMVRESDRGSARYIELDKGCVLNDIKWLVRNYWKRDRKREWEREADIETKRKIQK